MLKDLEKLSKKPMIIQIWESNASIKILIVTILQEKKNITNDTSPRPKEIDDIKLFLKKDFFAKNTQTENMIDVSSITKKGIYQKHAHIKRRKKRWIKSRRLLILDLMISSCFSLKLSQNTQILISFYKIQTQHQKKNKCLTPIKYLPYQLHQCKSPSLLLN